MGNLKQFKEFCNVKEFDDLLKFEPAKIHRLLEDWIMYLKEKVSPNSIPTMYYGVELFFDVNDIMINGKKLRRMFPATVKRSGGRPYTTEDIQQILSVARNRRDKAIIHFLASTGARIGSVDGLQLRHIEPMPNGYKSVLLYENSEEEYYAFLTPEASIALDEYLNERKEDGEKISPQSPLFKVNRYGGLTNPEPLTHNGTRNVIFRVVKQARLKRTKTVGRHYDIQIDMGFRKRFNTILKLNNEINSNVAEKLMAHKRGLDGAYLKPTRDQCFFEFSKAISDLTISQEERHKSTIVQQEKKISNLEQNRQEIEHLKKTVDLFGQLLAEQSVKNNIWKNLENPSHHHTPQQITKLKEFCNTEHIPEAWKELLELTETR